MRRTVHGPHTVPLGELFPADSATVLRLRPIGKVSHVVRHATLTVRLPRVKIEFTAYPPELIYVAVRETRIVRRRWTRGWDEAFPPAECKGVLFCFHLTEEFQYVWVGHHQGPRMGPHVNVRERKNETER